MSNAIQSQRKFVKSLLGRELPDVLCLQCGLCCNGVLFADVRSERGDSSPLFEQHGRRVAQPCPAFNQQTCACAIYAGRPARCRKFECAQLIGARDGTITTRQALRQIRAAQQLAAKVERLLGRLGFNDESLPLKRRFEQCQRAAEQGGIPAADFDLLAQSQLAFHQLNLLLAKKFFR